jgi:hypothetical protein
MHLHVLSLPRSLRPRCSSPPFAAFLILHYNTPTHWPHWDGLSLDETAEHALLDCPAYAELRAEPLFAPLFANLPAHACMRALTWRARAQPHLRKGPGYTGFLVDIRSQRGLQADFKQGLLATQAQH